MLEHFHQIYSDAPLVPRNNFFYVGAGTKGERREFKRGFLREFKRGQIQSEYFPRISGPVLSGGFGGSETAQNWRRG